MAKLQVKTAEAESKTISYPFCSVVVVFRIFVTQPCDIGSFFMVTRLFLFVNEKSFCHTTLQIKRSGHFKKKHGYFEKKHVTQKKGSQLKMSVTLKKKPGLLKKSQGHN